MNCHEMTFQIFMQAEQAFQGLEVESHLELCSYCRDFIAKICSRGTFSSASLSQESYVSEIWQAMFSIKNFYRGRVRSTDRFSS